jgi:hypothetical protein
MGHSSPKWLGFAPFSIHVVRIEIASLTGMSDDIGFSDCAAR